MKKLVIESLNELHSFERKMDDPLGALDIGQSHLNKIKRIEFCINDDDVGIDMFDKTPKSLKLKNDDIEIKKGVKKFAKDYIRSNSFEIPEMWIEIEYFDKDDETINTDQVY
jgi:hypothetical protein